jgi:hypothetical protein
MPDKKIKLHSGAMFPSSLTSLLLIFSLLVFPSCGSNTSAYDPQADYRQACLDASSVTPEKISKTLTAIVPENRNLIWENNVVGSRILVVSWVDQNACNIYKCPAGGCQPNDTCKEGKECQYSRDTYVTVAPELKNFFNGSTPTPMRIAQVLGLPPSDATNKACFLEMWVSPADLFRPTADPEITDHEAEIDFPASQYSTPFRTYSATELIFADQACDAAQCPACNQWGQCGFTDYPNYIKNRKKYIYTASSPYPWTALGYTYDWGNPGNHVGLSEFVVHGKKADGSKIALGIKAVTATESYFSN